jgi:hypothetical protein
LLQRSIADFALDKLDFAPERWLLGNVYASTLTALKLAVNKLNDTADRLLFAVADGYADAAPVPD